MPKSKTQKTVAPEVVTNGNSGEALKEISGIVKENYLIGLDAAHSLIEENKRFMDSQLEHLNRIQKEYAEQVKSAIGSMPGEYAKWDIGGGLELLLELQNRCFAAAKKTSDNYTKEFLDLNQKSAERAFSAMDRFVSSLEH
ncbi:MAG: hypothetical protein KJ002_05315 [Candidatus Dadabacteria bacterium]|jgi:hypothetical protein|nr:hypothetical protein [Candidatus Dadabacteria bacterium]